MKLHQGQKINKAIGWISNRDMLNAQNWEKNSSKIQRAKIDAIPKTSLIIKYLWLNILCRYFFVYNSVDLCYILQVVMPADGSEYIIDYYGPRLTHISKNMDTFYKPWE